MLDEAPSAGLVVIISYPTSASGIIGLDWIGLDWIGLDWISKQMIMAMIGIYIALYPKPQSALQHFFTKKN